MAALPVTVTQTSSSRDFWKWKETQWLPSCECEGVCVCVRRGFNRKPKGTQGVVPDKEALPCNVMEQRMERWQASSSLLGI